MKPSEAVGTVLEYSYYDPKGDGNYSARYMTGRKTRVRYPKTYAKRQHVKVGPMRVLKDNPYQAEVADSVTLVTREQTFSKSTGLLLNQDYRGHDLILSPTTWYNLRKANFEFALQTEFLTKLKGRITSLAEEYRNRKESLNLLATSATRIANYARWMFKDPYEFLKAGRKLSRKRLYKSIRTYGDVWLECRYFWLPAYLSLRDAFIELHEGLPYDKCFKQDAIVAEFTQEIELFHGKRRPFAYTTQCKWHSKYFTWLEVDEPATKTAQQAGLGSFFDPLAVVWETTPWTFVIDWVIPVSDVLLASGATGGANYPTSCTTFKEKRKLIWHQPIVLKDPVETASYIRRYDVIQYPSRTSEHYTRELFNPTHLKPALHISEDIVRWRRVVDSLALLTGSKMGQKVIRGKI